MSKMNATKKLLSVAVAGYNVEKTLRETLNPFLNCHGIEKLEVIIVNDGSSDNTSAIAQEYVQMCPDVFTVINKENGGWGSTINSGIRAARGKYFKQLDGDDYFNSRNLDNLLHQMAKTDADLVITPYIEFDDRTGNQMSVHSCNPGCKQRKKYNISSIKQFKPFMHAVCIKTELIKESVQITEHCFYTDTEFVLKALNQASTVMFFDKVIYCYRRASSGQSMSLSGFEKHYNEQFLVIQELIRYREQYVNRAEIVKMYDELLFSTCMWHYLVLLYLKPTVQHKKSLIEFDDLLKEKAPAYYEKTDIGTIQKLRKTKFLGYCVAAPIKKRKDNRFTSDGRMLY